MPQRRLHQLYDRSYPWVFATLGLFCVILAITNVALVVSNDGLRNSVHADHARIEAEGKARNIADVESCYQGAITGPRANLIVASLANDHRIRARQARALAKADPTAKLRRAHLTVARQQERLAVAIRPFPVPTMRECNERGARLVGKKLSAQLRASMILSTRGNPNRRRP